MIPAGAGKPVEIAERPGVSHTLSDFPLLDEFLVVLDSSTESTMSVVQACFAE
jgi:hypothetical protein